MTPTRLGKRVLFVGQYSPPSALSAARRTAGFTKYLSRLGYRVTVLTSIVSGLGEIEGATRVVRTGDLMSSRLNWRRHNLRTISGAGEGSAYGSASRLETIVVPDVSLLTWLPFALPRALRLARAERLDCVITTSPPESTHLVGLALRRAGIPWIADFRDGWTFETLHDPWPFAIQRRADSALERAVVRRADAVIGVTAPIAEDLRERFAPVRAAVITNGYDPEQIPRDVPADPLLNGDRHSLVHTGRMAVARRTPRHLLEAVRRLSNESPDDAGKLEIIFAGPLSHEERALIEAPDLAGAARAVGAVDHQQALRLQQGADSLLLFAQGSTRRSVATGKLYEYLAAGRPILVLGEESEAARIVMETGAGQVVAADDPAAIGEALRRLVRSSGTGATPGSVAKYSYPEIAAQVADLIEEVCGGRAE
jgi:glycosyltransferase involved in cell wall biosynthesis